MFLESWDWDLSKLMIRFWWTMPNFQILSKSKFRSSPKLPISSNFKFWWWEPILEILGFFDIDFKILEKSCNVCAPILGLILDNFDFKILVLSQSYNKPPWRNFDFWSNFDDIEKFEIWWNWQFWWTSKFGFWQNLEIWHRSPKSNHQFG